MIRAATPADARAVAPLIVQAMGALTCKFTGSDRPEEAIPAFEHFFSICCNQYSYENTLVFEDTEGIWGSVTAYNGARLYEYREVFFKWLQAHYGLSEVPAGDETSAGEFYIDTISVHPLRQGKGIGGQLIRAICARGRAEGHRLAGLLVEMNNTEARRLYERLGFRTRGKKLFAGHRYEHMVMDLAHNEHL